MGIKKLSRVESKLYALHNDAKKDIMRVGPRIVKSIFRPIQPKDFENLYLPISQSQGNSLRNIILKNDCKHIVEFGTSFGISTIYLADAARQIGGNVITTEILKSKAEKAHKNISEAGLIDYVDIKIGDALKTLKEHKEPIDFLFLDGWKDLYLPLFKMLEPRFHPSTLIYADNMDMVGTKFYANYLAAKNDMYYSEVVDQGKAFLTRLK